MQRDKERGASVFKKIDFSYFDAANVSVTSITHGLNLSKHVRNKGGAQLTLTLVAAKSMGLFRSRLQNENTFFIL